MRAGDNLFTLKSLVRSIQCRRHQIKYDCHWLMGKTEQNKWGWSGPQKSRMKGPKKEGTKSFQFPWGYTGCLPVDLCLISFLCASTPQQTHTNTLIVRVHLCSHSCMLQYQLIYNKCHRLIGNLLLLCAPKSPNCIQIMSHSNSLKFWINPEFIK